MQDFGATVRTVLEEIDALTDHARSLPEEAFERTTRCEGWDVRDLLRHTAAAMWNQAEAFHRVRLAIAEPPAFAEIGVAAGAELDALDTARGHLVSGLGAVDAGTDPIVNLAFATLPASFAVQVLLIEYGFHRNDLEWALGNETPLRREVAEVQVELLPAFLPMVAKPADDGTAFRLVAPSGTAEVVCAGGSWEAGTASATQTCTLTGDDSAIALFALGRIPATHPSLAVDDRAGLAGRFKEFFPGP